MNAAGVNAGVNTLSLLQTFYHGNREANQPNAMKHGQSAYYAVTEAVQGFRSVANNLHSRIRKVQECAARQNGVPARR